MAKKEDEAATKDAPTIVDFSFVNAMRMLFINKKDYS